MWGIEYTFTDKLWDLGISDVHAKFGQGVYCKGGKTTYYQGNRPSRRLLSSTGRRTTSGRDDDSGAATGMSGGNQLPGGSWRHSIGNVPDNNQVDIAWLELTRLSEYRL